MENKKTNLILIVVTSFLILVLLIVFTTIKVLNKKVYSVEEYSKLLKEEKYSVSDKSDIYHDNKNIIKYVESKDSKSKYLIDFYVMDTEKSSIKFYNDTKSKLEKEASGIKGIEKSNSFGYKKFILEASGNYSAIIKSDNTIVYLNANIKNKDEINRFIQMLGY